MSNPLVPAHCPDTGHEAMLPKEALEHGMIRGWVPVEEQAEGPAAAPPVEAGATEETKSADKTSAKKTRE